MSESTTGAHQPAWKAEQATTHGGGGRHHLAAEHELGVALAQGIGILDAVASAEQRGDHGHRFRAWIQGPRSGAQIDMLADQVGQTQALSEHGWQQEPGVADKGRRIKADGEASRWEDVT